MSEIRTQLLVVGGGPGGYAAAFRAADLGLEVTLVDPEENPGGVCLYRGCIPSKALLHVARVIGETSALAETGVEFGAPEIDVEALRDWKDRVVNTLTGGLGQLTEQRNIRHVRGRARFTSSNTVMVEGEHASVESIEFRDAILATGSVPRGLPGFPFDRERVWSSSEALDLPRIPESLLVIGGGYIGLEMASVYHAIGSQVTVVEALDSLLPGVDRDLVQPLSRRLKQSLASVFLETKADEPSITEDGVEVTLPGDDGPERRRFDQVLVAVGREARSPGLGLEKTQVEVGVDGFVTVDERRRTTDPNIYAIGDITGEPLLAHKASHEGRAAAEVISGEDSLYDPRAVPAVVYTDPAVAWCGLTEPEARRGGYDVEVASFPWGASGRAVTMGRRDGITKLVCEPGSGRILGAGITGPHAGELIAECVLAVEMGATATDLELTIHPHPTLSETIMEAAEAVFGRSTHSLKGSS